MSEEYPNIEEVLGIGRYNLKVYPKQEWDKDNNCFIKGSHKGGTAKNGNKWYMYATKINGKYLNLFAWGDKKEWFDSGTVEVNIMQKQVNGEPVFKAGGVPMLIAFYNEYQSGEIYRDEPKEEKQEVVKTHKDELFDKNDVEEDDSDLPF